MDGQKWVTFLGNDHALAFGAFELKVILREPSLHGVDILLK